MYTPWMALSLCLAVILIEPTSGVQDIPETLFDYIVVGGGTAGCVLADRLSNNHTVLLLEAGPSPPNVTAFPGKMFTLKALPLKWNYTDSKQKPVYVSRVLGGTSTISLLIYLKTGRGDFKNMDKYYWNWETLVPYFDKLEQLRDQRMLEAPDRKYFGVNGRIGLTREISSEVDRYFRMFEEIGLDNILSLNPETPFGVTRTLTHIAGGVRQSSASKYLQEFRPGLKILTGSEVTQITFQGKRATGVQAKMCAKTVSFRATKEVIVSAGAINTPKLLLNSGVGPKKQLKELNIPVVLDLPVGENLLDNTILIMVHTFRKRNGTCRRRRGLEKYPLPSITTASTPKYSQRPPYAPVSVLAIEPFAERLRDFCVIFFGLSAELCDRISAEVKEKEVLFTIFKNSESRSQGSVKLRSNDPSDMPLIEQPIYKNPLDFEDMVAYAKDFARIEDTETYKNFGGSLFDLSLGKCGVLGTDEYWRCHVRRFSLPFYHLCGTTTEAGGVVDGALRVRGVRGLRVVDAGVFPAVPGQGPLPAVLLLAERAADIILLGN